MQTNISTTRALVPIYAIPPALPIQGHETQGRLNGSERRKDGVVFIGREFNRVKALYGSSGRMEKATWRTGNLIDIHA
ncbi:MAG: hypothetical protein WAL98_05785 [Desulfatiglandaceae bacterium]